MLSCAELRHCFCLRCSQQRGSHDASRSFVLRPGEALRKQTRLAQAIGREWGILVTLKSPFPIPIGDAVANEEEAPPHRATSADSNASRPAASVVAASAGCPNSVSV